VPTKDQSLLGVTDDASGVATIHLPQGFFEQIAPEDQLLAIGQLVLTITEVRGIGQVLFVQDGQLIGVPRRSGGVTDGTEPLARRDYQDLLNPAPIPTTSTTTIPPVVPVETTIV
jgi:spore germination protein GerM